MWTRVARTLAGLYRDEEGAQLIEYILMCALIALASLAGITFVGQVDNNKMNNVGERIQ